MLKMNELLKLEDCGKSYYYDFLTGLPNRNYLYQIFNQIESLNIFQENIGLALIYVDFDNFKYINDTFGHRYGDKFLKMVGKILKEISDDNGMIFRLSGDEFITIIFYPLNEIKKVSELAERILDRFRNYIKIDIYEVLSTVSIGISLYPEHSSNLDELLKYADIALYESKMSGKDTYIYFNDYFERKIKRKSEIFMNLKKAVKSNEIYLEFQPQLDIKENKIVGVEVLLRWKSRELGTVSPQEFIPIAEETKLIIDLGKWVIDRAFRICKKWCEKGYLLDTSINISAIQLHEDNFHLYIKDMLKKYDINPSLIKFEVTESQIMQSKKENIKRLNRIKELGIEIILDDFGTGYSSLNYLTFLPVDEIKIDKSFIDLMLKNYKVYSIVDAIAYLSKKLGYKVTAEGVENKLQFDLLKKMFCDKIQGYYVSKPLSEEELEKFIKNHLK